MERNVGMIYLKRVTVTFPYLYLYLATLDK